MHCTLMYRTALHCTVLVYYLLYDVAGPTRCFAQAATTTAGVVATIIFVDVVVAFV